MDNIRILIVDDHPMMREALATALVDEPNLQVVGQAGDGNEALQLAAQLHPDLALVDLLMPGMDGLETISRLLELQPQLKILVVTSLEDEQKILAAIQAGALGYFPKTAPRPYLLEAIRKVADGIPYLPSGIALKLFKGLREMNRPVSGRSATDEPLTTRQQELLALMGEGRSDLEIAQMLHLSEATVRSHVHNIIQRLGLETRSQAVAHVHRAHTGT
jgi:two-component system, NarL family, response regulator LiaR